MKGLLSIFHGLARVFQGIGSVDSSIFYSKEVFQKWNSTSYQKGVLEAVVILADAYRTTNQRDSLIKYLVIGVNHHGKRADAIVKGMLEHGRRRKSTNRY